MTEFSNEELQSKIEIYQNILSKRTDNKPSINVKNTIRNCCQDVNVNNVNKLIKYVTSQKEGYNNKNYDLVICYYYYNGLTVENKINKIGDLYLLYRKEVREQCESDSSYDSDQVNSNEEVTKIKNISYLTKTDLLNFLGELLNK
jgi:hypothetical protein